MAQFAQHATPCRVEAIKLMRSPPARCIGYARLSCTLWRPVQVLNLSGKKRKHKKSSALGHLHHDRRGVVSALFRCIAVLLRPALIAYRALLRLSFLKIATLGGLRCIEMVVSAFSFLLCFGSGWLIRTSGTNHRLEP